MGLYFPHGAGTWKDYGDDVVDDDADIVDDDDVSEDDANDADDNYHNLYVQHQLSVMAKKKFDDDGF